MRRPFPLAASLLALPLLFAGCDAADDDDVVDPVDGTPPAVVDPVDGDDGDLDPVISAESGSETSMLDGAGYTPVAFEEPVTFEIPGMVCEYTCAPEVEKALANLPGVDAESIETDIETHTATFKVADGFDVEAAKIAVAAAGQPIGHDFTVANVN